MSGPTAGPDGAPVPPAGGVRRKLTAAIDDRAAPTAARAAAGTILFIDVPTGVTET